MDFSTPIKSIRNSQIQYLDNNFSSLGLQQQQSRHLRQKLQIKRLKNYELGQLIGQGTFNKVRLGRHTLTNEKVAIKIIQKNTIISQSDKKRLNMQLKILRKVRHPHISQLYQILQDNQNLYVISQYCQKGELFQHITSEQNLSQFQSCKFLLQILSSIQYIHQLGICHRDLKPQNLLLDSKYNIKLIDFGLSNIYDQGQKLRTACGSPCYAAPEMLQGKFYHGLKADVWSVGIILFAMSFGYLPFDNPNAADLYREIAKGDYQLPEDTSKQLKSLLKIILQVDPQKRATIDQIRAHPFCKFSKMSVLPGIIVGLSDIPYEQQIGEQMIFLNNKENLPLVQQQKFKKQLKYSIKCNKHNDLSSTYYLILSKNLRRQNLTVINYYTKKNNLINRYAIAQKMKDIYQKKLKQRLEYSRKQKLLSSQKKKYSNTGFQYQNQQFKTTPYSKTHKKQMFKEINNTHSNNQKKTRKIQTSNTKRANKQIKSKKFKKTCLAFDQIQLQQKKLLSNNKSIQKRLKNEKSVQKQRFRNKSVSQFKQKVSNDENSLKRQYINKENQKINKENQKINKKNYKSSKKKRSKSQNYLNKINKSLLNHTKLTKQTHQIKSINKKSSPDKKTRNKSKSKEKHSLIYQMTD